jgi:hypothetical protein
MNATVTAALEILAAVDADIDRAYAVRREVGSKIMDEAALRLSEVERMISMLSWKEITPHELQHIMNLILACDVHVTDPLWD